MRWQGPLHVPSGRRYQQASRGSHLLSVPTSGGAVGVRHTMYLQNWGLVMPPPALSSSPMVHTALSHVRKVLCKQQHDCLDKGLMETGGDLAQRLPFPGHRCLAHDDLATLEPTEGPAQQSVAIMK